MKFHSGLKSTLLAVAMMAAGAGTAFADLLADVQAAGKLNTATEMHFAPFDLLVNGEYQGFGRDLMDAIGEEMGITMDYQDLPWSSILPGLEVKKFDFVNAPVIITPERAERYAFTLPFADATVSLVKKAGNDSIAGPEGIAGKTVGGQKGTAQLEEVKAYAAGLDQPVKFREYSSFDEAYADLAAGRLDAVVASSPNLTYLVSQRPEIFAMVEPAFGAPKYYAWVARKEADSESFIKAFNDALIKLQDNGKIAEIQQKWLGTTYALPKEMPAM